VQTEESLTSQPPQEILPTKFLLPIQFLDQREFLHQGKLAHAALRAAPASLWARGGQRQSRGAARSDATRAATTTAQGRIISPTIAEFAPTQQSGPPRGGPLFLAE
jgi:hypothetical protein